MKNFSYFPSCKKAFTLLELTLVMALFFIIVGIAVPYGFRFFNVERLDSVSRSILTNLRLAQSQAASQSFDSNFGVYVSTTTFTFFRGNSYASRSQTYDQVFDIAGGIDIDGAKEIVFQKLSGLPALAGEITLTNGERSNIIRISNQGLVSLDLNVTIGTP